MDDLAPTPAQRTSDSIGRTPEQGLAGRKKAARRVPPVPAPKQELEPDRTPEPESGHQLDLLA